VLAGFLLRIPIGDRSLPDTYSLSFLNYDKKLGYSYIQCQMSSSGLGSVRCKIYLFGEPILSFKRAEQSKTLLQNANETDREKLCFSSVLVSHREVVIGAHYVSCQQE